MPTVAIIGPYRFYFWSGDRDERPHVHVDRDGDTAKFWIDVVELVSSRGYSAHELRVIHKIVVEYQVIWREKWHEYFNR